jgi:hypothetical protein
MSAVQALSAYVATGDDRHRFLRFSDGERPALDALIDALGLQVVDTIDAQLAEWARIQMPGAERGGAEHQALVADALAGGSAFSYGMWAFFPWRRALVHLLPKDAFREVRTNRNRDKITPAEQASLLTRRIGVVGLSVGHASALVLAQEGLCDELRIADFDTIDLSNLNRLRTTVMHLGTAKVVVTRREIAEIDPYIRVRTFPEGLTEANADAFIDGGGRLDLMVEECDTLPMKLRVRELCRARRIPVVMDTNDRGTLDVERFDLEPDRPILHGLMGDLDAARAAALPPAERMDVFYRFFGGADRLSERLRTSMPKIGSELCSYPQLSSDVHLGAALVAHAAREVMLGRLTRSGRFLVDLDELIRDGAL